MALMKCRECGKDVSTEAESCPSCGAKAPALSKAGKWWADTIAIAIFGGLIGAGYAIFKRFFP